MALAVLRMQTHAISKTVVTFERLAKNLKTENRKVMLEDL